jgi:hypothetical protein
MPGYVSKVLSKFQHDAPKHPQHTPSRYVMPVYGAKTKYATKDETPPLTAQQCLTIQKVTGSVLYYARAVDPTVLMPLNGKDASRHESNVGLLSNPPGHHNQISRLRHDIAHPQRCLLPLGIQRTEPSRRSLFPREQNPLTRNTERIHPQRRRRHQKRGGLSCRIRSWSVLSQRPKWRPAQSHTHRAGPHTTPNASANR